MTTIAAHPLRSKVSTDSASSYEGESVEISAVREREATSASIATSFSTDSFSSNVSSSTASLYSSGSSESGYGSPNFSASSSCASSLYDASSSPSLNAESKQQAAITMGPELHCSLLTSAWRPEEILTPTGTFSKFIKPILPPGINFRHFRMQGPKYASISDIVVFADKGGFSEDAVEVARRAAAATVGLYNERRSKGEDCLLYNVYVVSGKFDLSFLSKVAVLCTCADLGSSSLFTSFVR